jgi:polyphosphate kinase
MTPETSPSAARPALTGESREPVSGSPAVAESRDLKHPALYINRELGWLEFNQRVLDQAWDASHPLLERVTT